MVLETDSDPVPVSSQGDGKLVVWLDAAGLGSMDQSVGTARRVLGGKGASLARLAGFGAPVPPASCLTTHAYTRFATAHGLPQRAHDVSDADLPALRQTIEAAPLPPELTTGLNTTFATMHANNGDMALAVRSSAPAEDSVEHSFAGLHETILNVRDFAGLEAAIKACWASLWTERAVAYRRANGLDREAASIAVVVQRLIQTDVAFVVFTSDPVSGRSNHAIINASWGLGEALVSGTVTPDHVVVGADGRVLDYRISDKAVMCIPGPHPSGGSRQVAVPRALRTMPALTPEQAMSIAGIARGLADQLGYPADIEGGLAANQPYLFQARPITTRVTDTR